MWLPGQGRYRELMSCSNTTDYQARRLECRVRGDDGNRPVHTLNGTACAVGRTLIALLENGQREDGSVALPEALHPYLPEDLRTADPLEGTGRTRTGGGMPERTNGAVLKTAGPQGLRRFESSFPRWSV